MLSFGMPQKLLSLIMTLCLLPWPQLYAQQIILPVPGQLVGVSSPHNPLLIKGIKVHPDNPFRFDFILDNASEKSAVALAKVDSLKEESTRLIKYFLASLTTPEKDMWVNLSPYEKDRIVPESFGQTEMGRDLLAQDYLLKQVTASLIYPEGDVGKAFWKSVYEESAKKHGGRLLNVPISMFNKVWIVPNKAVVYENAQAGTAYVVESSLKVMLEEDYVALTQNNFGKTKSRHAAGASSQSISTSHHPSPRGVAGDDAIVPLIAQSKQPASETPASKDQKVSEIIRQIVIPVLTQEINEGANFAQLRQVYNALILATWYKKKISAIGGSASGGGGNILSQIYQDQNKIRGTEYKDDLNVKAIYQKYLEAFKKGVYNYIKDEPDPASQKIIPKKYFSGGMLLTPEIKLTRDFNNPQINQAMIVNVNLINATFPYENHSASNFNWNLNEADAMNFIPSLGLSDKDEVLSIGGTAHQYMDQVRWEYLFAGFGHHVKVYQPDRAHYLAWKNRYNNINVLPMQLLKMISLINEDFTLDSVKPNSQSVIILPAVLSDPDIDAVTMMRDALEALKNEKYMVVEWYNSKDSYQEVEFRKTDKVLNVYKKEGYEFEEINRGENAHHQWRVYKVKKPSVNQTKNNSASTMTFDLQDNELSQEEVDFQENVIGKLSLKAHSNILSIGGTSDHKLFNGLKQLRLELLFARLKHRVTVFQPNMNTWLQDILIEPWKSAKENIDFNKQHFGKDSGIAPRSQSVVLMMSVLSSWGITFQKKVQILEEALNTLAEDGSLILGWYNWDEQFKAEEFGRTQEVLDWFRRNGYSFEETTRGESGAHEWRVYHVKKPDAAMKNASQVAVYQNWLKQMDGLVIKGKRNGKRYAFVNTQAAFLHQDEFSINEIDAQGKVISENIGDFTVSFQAGTLRLHGIVLYNNKRDDRGQSIFSQILGTMPNELDIEIEDIANLATLRNMFEAIQDQNLDKEFIRDVEVFATRSRVFTKDDHNSVHIDNRIMTEEEHQGLMQIFYDYDKQASAKPNALKSLNAIAADSLMGQILKKSGINRPIHVAFKRLGESRVMNFHIKAEHTLRDRQVRDFAMKSKRGTTLTRRDFIGVFAAAIAASPLFSTAITRRNPQEQIDVDQLSEQIEYFLAKHFEFNVSFTGQFMADQLNAMAEKEKVFLIFGDHFVSFYDRLRADIHAASLKHMRIFDDPDVRQHIATMVTQMHATKQLPKSPYLNKDLQQFFEGPWLMYMIMDQNRFDADEHVANDLLYQAEKFSPELLHMMRKLLSGDHRAQSMMKFQEEWNAFNEHYLMARNYYVVLNVNKEPNGALYYSSQGYKIVSREMKQIKGEDITVLYVASIVSSDEVVYFTSSMEKSRSILIDTEVGLELVDDILQSRNAKETLKLKVYGVKDNYGQDMLQDAMRQLFKDHTRKQVEQYVLRKALVHELAYQARVLYNVDYRGIDRFDVAKDSWDKLTEHLKRWIDYKAVSYLAQFIKAPDARTELIEMYAYYLTERKGTEYIAARWIVNMMDDAPKNEWTKSRHPDAMKKQFARLMAQDSTILQSKAKALIQEFWSPELLKAIEEDLAMSAVTLPTMLTRRQFNFAGMLSMFVSGVVEANGDLDAQEFLESKKNEIMSVYRFLYLGQFLSIYAPKIHVVFQPGLTVPQILPNQNIVILPLEKYESLHQESFFARLVLDLAFYATLMQNPSNGKVYSVVNYQTAQNERIKALEMLIKYKRIDEIDGSLIASEEISIKRALHRIIFNNLGILNKEDQLKAFEVEGITFEQEKQMRVLLRNREYGKTVHVIYDMERDTIKVESKAVDSAQMSRAQIEQGNNRAQYGGIDFNSDTMDLSIKDNGERMAFNVDANLIKRYQNAEGFFPIVTGMVHIPQGPLGVQQLRDFLGVTQN